MAKESFSFSGNAVKYSWRQLIQRTGLGEVDEEGGILSIHGVPLFYSHPNSISHQGRKIIVIPCRNEDWHVLLKKDEHSIDWLLPGQLFPARDEFPYKTPIPVIFWGDVNEHKTAVEYHNDETLIFNVDILATAFFMLSRWEEINTDRCDTHGRFPAFASVAYRQGFLDTPIVDLYALILREWMRKFLPEWLPEPLELKINITHDIDWTYHFSDAGHFMRMFGSELVKKKSLQGGIKQIRNLFVQLLSPARDAYFKAIYELAEISEANGLSSHFYFMAAETSQYQPGYDPSSTLVRQCMTNLQRRGHEIGVHPGYETFGFPERLIEEKQRLESVLGKNTTGGRQHYLLFSVPFTWRHWEQAGLCYDSTMGYADCEGFRCGTCRPYQPFDIQEDRAMSIQEIPLIVMDKTLIFYRSLTAEQAENRILELAGKCADVGGTFTLLWHNTFLLDEGQDWAVMYRKVLAQLSRMQNISSSK